VRRLYSPSGEIVIGSEPRLGTLAWSAIGVALLLIGALAGFLLLTGSSAPKPTLQILTPSDGATVSGGEVLVVVQVKNTPLGSTGTPRSDRSYGLIYYRDVVPPTAAGKPAVTAPGSWVKSTSTSNVWKLSGSGRHTLSVQLVNSDGTPLRSPVVGTVTINVPSTPASVPLPSSEPVLPPGAGFK
jgi:hypothetical protein